MSAFDGIRRVFRIGMAGGDVDREIERELDFHFEQTVEELMASGLDERAAREEAERRFGDVRRYRGELRKLDRGRERRARAAGGFRIGWEVLGEAFRGVRRAPALAAAVVTVMALGIGVNGTMFAMLDRVFLSAPEHVRGADRIRRPVVQRRGIVNSEVIRQSTLTYPDYRDWDGVEAFSATAAYDQRNVTLGHGAGAVRVSATLVTASYFPLLGVSPALGRFFTPEDDAFGATPVAVLGYDTWRSRFGGRRDVLGEVIDVGEGRYTVVGVTPEGFTGVDLERVDLWLPFHVAGELENGGRDWVDTRNWYWFQALVRLAPGVSDEVASEQATAVHRAGRADLRDFDPASTVLLEPLEFGLSSRAPDEVAIAPWLMGVAFLVLLIACANVANLFLARAMRRRREAAVRLALGVSRARLFAVRVLESILLTAAGGVAALVLASWGSDVVRALLLPDLAWNPSATDPKLIVFVAATAVVAGLLAGLIPAVQSSRPDIMDTLKAGGRGTTGGRNRLRAGLLAVQAALSVVLLAGTGLFIRSLDAARGVDLGFEPHRMLMVTLEPEGGYPGAEPMVRLYRQALDRVGRINGIEAAALATTIPFRNARAVDIRVPGLDSIPSTDAGSPYINAVTPGFFRAMGTEVVRGRGFDAADDVEGAQRVVLVNETMARLLWPADDALGQCIITENGPCATVVGVVEDSRRFGLDEPASMKYYVPLSQAPFPWPPRGLVARTTADPAAFVAAVQGEVQAALENTRMVRAQPFDELVAPEYRAWRLGAALFAAFGLLALAVAGVGLYSLLAFNVAERTGEIGVRSALGASRQRIVRQVVAGGLAITALGVVVGLAGTLVAGRWVRPLLYHTSPYDPLVLGAVALAMLLVAAVASGIPASRAARVDPAQALRTE